MSVSSNDIDTDEDQERVYGEWTPVKPVGEIELSEWTTLTPGGEWPSLSTTLASGSALTPTRPFSPALGLPPIEFSDSPSRPSSRAEGDGIKGINEILEQMEDGEALREREAALADQLLPPPNPDTSEDSSPSESVATPREPANSLVSSPFVSGSSVLPVPSATPNGLAATAVVPSPDPAVCAPTPLALSQPKPVPVLQGGRRQRGMQLDISAPAFIPPPPMCMFFSPAFRDLQKGKVAVWKGDLTVRGRGGGTFNILIVGEEGSDNAW
jgi:hypothetical protein